MIALIRRLICKIAGHNPGFTVEHCIFFECERCHARRPGAWGR